MLRSRKAAGRAVRDATASRKPGPIAARGKWEGLERLNASYECWCAHLFSLLHQATLPLPVVLSSSVASNTTLNWASYFFPSDSSLRTSSAAASTNAPGGWIRQSWNSWTVRWFQSSSRNFFAANRWMRTGSNSPMPPLRRAVVSCCSAVLMPLTSGSNIPRRLSSVASTTP